MAENNNYTAIGEGPEGDSYGVYLGMDLTKFRAECIMDILPSAFIYLLLSPNGILDSGNIGI